MRKEKEKIRKRREEGDEETLDESVDKVVGRQDDTLTDISPEYRQHSDQYPSSAQSRCIRIMGTNRVRSPDEGQTEDDDLRDLLGRTTDQAHITVCWLHGKERLG
ncbi:hypothetical protein RB195_003586 [Necator americanus]|uniref:Uncharacterized protein n=1 Tax=Necator americanus TaxID=51031 RepID=A0ABR1DPS9_NECAM